MEFLAQVKTWQIEGRTLILDSGWEGKVRLTAAMPGVVQVTLHRGNPWFQEPLAPSLTVNPAAWPKLEAPEVQESDDYLLATFPGVTVRVQKRPIRLEFFLEGQEQPVLADSPGGGLWWEGWNVGARFRLDPADQFFGIGEPDQQKGPIPFNHKGRRYPIFHRHIPAPSQMVLPVLISHRGYGLFVDNPWLAEWDLGTDGATFGYTAQGGQLTYYFMAGPELPTVLDRLTAITGRPSLAPKWTFGYLQSKFGYKNRAEVEELVNTFQAKGIPLDCVILDLYWFKRMGDLAWNKTAFPNPEEMIAQLKAQGVKIIVIEEPYLTTDSRLFPEAERLGILGKRTDGSTYTFPFWAGECGLVDFTQPLAKQWWADQHKPLMDMGIGGWWTDLNEPEDHPQDMIFRGGIGPAVHNVYNFHMLKSLKLAQEQHQPDQRLVIMSRSGWPGVQALGAATWSGDVAIRWEALANQPALGLSMSMVGMPYWNTDIGGFSFEESTPSELYVRWMQFGAFTPIMRPHGAHKPREPWAFGEEAEAIATDYIKLRYRLLPYTYTLAREAFTIGLPFMRPLVLHYPNDRQTLHLRDQYLWGRDILVAPVVTPDTTSRRVYLPEGTWVDFWTNRRIKGGRYITATAPLDKMPLFVREGAILPLAPERSSTGGAWEDLTLALYPGGEPSSFTLYEDDGESTAFEQGAFATTTFAVTPSAEGLEVRIGGAEGSFAGQVQERAYRLEVRLPKRPVAVTAAGNELIARRSLESLNRAATGWWYDQKLRVLHVKLATGITVVRIDR